MEESNMVSDHSKCVTFDALVAMPTGTEDHDGGPEAQRRAWERLLTASSRGALAGLTLKGGLHLLSAAVRVLSRGAQQQQRPAGKNAGRGRDPLTDALRDTVSYTLFLGSLAGVYVIVDEGLAAALGRERTRRWRAFAAGAAAGPALLLTGAGSRHYSLATYVLLRGLTLLVRQGNKASTAEAHPLLHRLLALTRTAHGDVALMCLSAAQIVYSFIMEPASLPASYVRFISRAAGKSTAVVAAVRELAVRNAGGQPPLPLPCLLEGGHSAALGAAHACSPNPGIPCSYLHHGASCSGHVAQLLPATYVRALAVYLPVYVAPAALLHRRKLLSTSHAPELWAKLLAGVARSSAFLAAYVSLVFAGACVGHHLTGVSTGGVIAASVWAGGLATLLEKKTRRMELAHYCAARALESFARCLSAWGWLGPPDARWRRLRLDVLLFSLACGSIMHCYSDDGGAHRDVFRSKYISVLDSIFGNRGHETGAIRHVPSNLQLLQLGAKALKSSGSLRSLVVDPDNRTVLPALALPSAAAAAQHQAASCPLAEAGGVPGCSCCDHSVGTAMLASDSSASEREAAVPVPHTAG